MMNSIKPCLQAETLSAVTGTFVSPITVSGQIYLIVSGFSSLLFTRCLARLNCASGNVTIALVIAISTLMTLQRDDQPSLV
jgi:hypothetical protein